MNLTLSAVPLRGSGILVSSTAPEAETSIFWLLLPKHSCSQTCKDFSWDDDRSYTVSRVRCCMHIFIYFRNM